MKSQPEHSVDNRQVRGEATRQALMRAAEKLIAQRGLADVAIKDIVTEAGQRNASALQYHFGSLGGLITAIHRDRAVEIQDRRGELLNELLRETAEPEPRQLCELMIRPAFELARARRDFLNYVKAFGHELALLESSAFARASRGGAGGSSGARLGRLLKDALPHLTEEGYRVRMDYAVRLCAASIYHQARQPRAFRGRNADLFLHSLTDALLGLLSEPESAATRALRTGTHTPAR